MARVALVLVLGGAACSDPPASAPDAAVPDAAIPAPDFDASPPDAGTAPLPDLTLNSGRARIDLALQTKSFDIDSCELHPDEACIGGPGDRTLLHFSVETPNIGNADMILGAPSPGNDQFQYSQCHEHFHFLGYAEYDLLDSAGNPVAVGQKQAFCLLDSEKFLTNDPTVSNQSHYWCGDQGIQRGWSDVYHSRLPCQYVDVTDTPSGDYTLRISINNGGTLPELTMDNNIAEIPVTIGDPNLATPTEACETGFDTHTSDGLNRECGWTQGEAFSCSPGKKFTIGCAASCMGIGSCTGDPMMRVCDATRPDGNCSFPAAIDSNDDACGTQCPLVFNETCPASGEIVVYHAPFSVGDAYTCNVEIRAN